MKALVTGAGGFIGRTLIGELDTLGFEVHAFNGNLSDREALRQAVRDVDYIFHLEEVAQARRRKDYFDKNSRGTEYLADIVARTSVKLSRFIYVSNLAAGGPADSLKPRTEVEKDRPVSFYGQSKLQGEKALLKYQSIFPLAIVRPPLVYGPGDCVVSLLIQTVARNFLPLLQGSARGGHKYYSTVHVQDLCRGIVQLAVASPSAVSSGDKFYLAGDGYSSLQDLGVMIAEKLNRDPLKIKIPKGVIQSIAFGLRLFNIEKLNQLLPDYWICSNQKARRVFGFVPEFDLARGISQVVDWYKQGAKGWRKFYV